MVRASPVPEERGTQMRTKDLYKELRRYRLTRKSAREFVRIARRSCRTNAEIHEMAFQAFVRLPVIYGLEGVYLRLKAMEEANEQ